MAAPAPLYQPSLFSQLSSLDFPIQSNTDTFSSDTFKPTTDPTWVYNNLQDIASVLQRALGRELEVAHAPPAKAQDGWVRIADGTNWDPGSGAGAYYFLDGQWQAMGGGPSSGLPPPNSITHDMLQDGIVWDVNLGDSSVTTEKVDDGAIITAKIGDLQVVATKLADGSITTPKLVDGAVLEAKLGDLAVSLQKLGVGAVDPSKILDGAVINVKIGNDAVTNAKIADLAVGTTELQVAAVTTATIAAGAVTTNQLGALVVLAQNIGAGEVTATKIGAQAVITGKIAAGAVTTNELAAGSVSTIKLQAGAVTANEIAAGAIVSAKIAAAQILSSHIQAAQITAVHVAANSITVDKLTSSSGTFGTTAFILGLNISITGIQSGATFNSASSTNFALSVGNSGGGTALGCGSYGSGGVAVLAVGSTNPFFLSPTKQAALGNTAWAGFFQSDAGKSVQLCTDSFAVVYAGGVSGSFTGGHDGLYNKLSTLPEVGDILVDTGIEIRRNVYDTIGYVEISSSAEQQGVVGVFAEKTVNHIPPTMMLPPDGKPFPKLDPAYNDLLSAYDVVVVNAIGEGLINVCGEGGDLSIGDFIVTSSMPGKGMKQSDNIFRAITVAKSRENVTFASSDEVKQIACIYMGG